MNKTTPEPIIKKKAVNLYLPVNIIKFLKMYSASENIGISKLVEQLIRKNLPKEITLTPDGGVDIK